MLFDKVPFIVTTFSLHFIQSLNSQVSIAAVAAAIAFVFVNAFAFIVVQNLVFLALLWDATATTLVFEDFCNLSLWTNFIAAWRLRGC